MSIKTVDHRRLPVYILFRGTSKVNELRAKLDVLIDAESQETEKTYEELKEAEKESLSNFDLFTSLR